MYTETEFRLISLLDISFREALAKLNKIYTIMMGNSRGYEIDDIGFRKKGVKIGHGPAQEDYIFIKYEELGNDLDYFKNKKEADDLEKLNEIAKYMQWLDTEEGELFWEANKQRVQSVEWLFPAIKDKLSGNI